MKKRFWLIVACLCLSTPSIASPDGLKAFEKSQSDIKIAFLECVAQLQLYHLSEKEKDLDGAANCIKRLKGKITLVVDAFKKANSNADDQKVIEIWQNNYSDYINIAIKHQVSSNAFEKLVLTINDTDKLIVNEIQNNYLERLAKEPVVNVNPDFEHAPPRN